MKRTIITLYALAAVALSAAAQARFTSNTQTVSLGQVQWKHPAMATYTVTNIGTEPLQFTHVEPDCACTTTRLPHDAIAPGAKGTIEVTFDAKALGHFHKSVAVYTNADAKPVYLYLEGVVVGKLTDFTRSHPYSYGKVRTDINEIYFADVRHGEHPQLRIGVVNEGEQPYEPVLMHLPSFLEMKAEPAVLQQGEQGVITLTLHTSRLADLGLTQTSVYLRRFLGDKVSDENELPVSAILLPDFSKMSVTEKDNAPALRLSATELDFAAQLARKKRVKQDITLTNAGKTPLQISKLQVFHPAVGVSLKSTLIMPGESTRLRVTVTKKNIGKIRRHLRLLMITNDPLQTKVEIDIKAK